MTESPLLPADAAPPSLGSPLSARQQPAGAPRRPNPILERELLQTVRLVRLPVLLSVGTALLTLIMSAVGATMATNAGSSTVGTALFHTFFALAWFAVSFVAPAMAASAIAAERAGRTWEPLQLTQLGAREIAHGKFWAATANAWLFVTMLLPVGALPFLFGGVAVVELAVAFVLLYLLSALGVGLGLSISAQLSNAGAAFIVTLIVSSILSVVVFVLMLSGSAAYGLSDLSGVVPTAAPGWIATAWARAPTHPAVLVGAGVVPLLAIVSTSWLFLEVTVANLRAIHDDRSTGFRVWLLGASAGLLILGYLLITFDARVEPQYGIQAHTAAAAPTLIIAALAFAGEPLGPSRRVRIQWERAGASGFRRWLGPSVERAAHHLVLTALVVLGAPALLAASLQTATTDADVLRCFAMPAHFFAFVVFLAGACVLLRSVSQSATAPRALLGGALVLAFVGPWLAAGLTAVVTHEESAMSLAAPSPWFPAVLNTDSAPDFERNLTATLWAAMGWLLLGVAMLIAGSLRVRQAVARHEAAIAALGRALGTSPPPADGDAG